MSGGLELPGLMTGIHLVLLGNASRYWEQQAEELPVPAVLRELCVGAPQVRLQVCRCLVLYASTLRSSQKDSSSKLVIPHGLVSDLDAFLQNRLCSTASE